jgi:hypothetical protein
LGGLPTEAAEQRVRLRQGYAGHSQGGGLARRFSESVWCAIQNKIVNSYVIEVAV